MVSHQARLAEYELDTDITLLNTGLLVCIHSRAMGAPDSCVSLYSFCQRYGLQRDIGIKYFETLCNHEIASRVDGGDQYKIDTSKIIDLIAKKKAATSSSQRN